ncbi:hypothetical protein AN639_12805 [Candidatus Epulonipiscium fishelsonii]|uniref:Uncharacterized protein n=1 Tax=Candidatus Epulonipiscium fishelsonii TaxID=77094 RepID=A0ACC8X7T0_9FIRM|nr:hypothetical protein AN396_12625 [Epulopiscium sp. SCG-B11WGA-EpuloA1]ONI42209.1 hypothetical protein AN639_12805 [Epulopiscium sp. SCG-B05WGA-EpuloA1]ONI47692.1 hypothetical protein AN643_04080 [Epulopiscium sp. SCG-B10WGA-EpuloB]
MTFNEKEDIVRKLVDLTMSSITYRYDIKRTYTECFKCQKISAKVYETNIYCYHCKKIYTNIEVYAFDNNLSYEDSVTEMFNRFLLEEKKLIDQKTNEEKEALQRVKIRRVVQSLKTLEKEQQNELSDFFKILGIEKSIAILKKFDITFHSSKIDTNKSNIYLNIQNKDYIKISLMKTKNLCLPAYQAHNEIIELDVIRKIKNQLNEKELYTLYVTDSLIEALSLVHIMIEENKVNKKIIVLSKTNIIENLKNYINNLKIYNNKYNYKLNLCLIDSSLNYQIKLIENIEIEDVGINLRKTNSSINERLYNQYKSNKQLTIEDITEKIIKE